MPRQLLPAEASEDARAALAAARITVLAITSQRNGDMVTTTVRVNVGDADRVLAVLRKLPYGGTSSAGEERGTD
jgi:hypothetical protein